MPHPPLIQRLAETSLSDHLSVFRVVIVNGPRQAGKTTLVRMLQERIGGSFRSLDDEETLRAAVDDRQAFVSYGQRPHMIDEIQLGGEELIRAIKRAVDENPAKGQFVLTGSTRFLTVPTLSESLAGRAGIIELWPFSGAERFRGSSDFAATLFSDPRALLAAAESPWSRDDYVETICEGGFPEAVALPTAEGRRAWHQNLLRSVTARDVRAFAQLQHANALPTILGVAAARAGTPLVQADVGRQVGRGPHTIRDYLSYLETVFLASTVPAWSTNLSARFTKTPKTFVTDSGLAASLLGVSSEALAVPGHPALGGLTETFVHGEILKLAAATTDGFSLWHYRDRDGREIDFILETPDGRVVAVEVKASLSPTADSTRHLHWLRDRLGDRFVAGVILYFGRATYSRGDRLYLAPISALWGHAPRQP